MSNRWHRLRVRGGRELILAAGLLWVCWPAGLGNGQATPSTSPTLPPVSGAPHMPGDILGDSSPLAVPNAAKLEHMREDDRRKRLLADTARLVELSTELQSEVQKSSKDELSLEVIRKATELEKLAHDVKERMKS